MATSIALIGSASAANIIVDFTATGNSVADNDNGLVFSSQDLDSTGVSFDITVSAVIPDGGGANSANSGNVARLNGGVGSRVENTGGFVNVIAGVPEVLRFTISNVVGLQAGQTLQLANLLSQNSSNNTNADQSGGSGATFGQQSADSVTITLGGTSVVINQSDGGDLGSSLLLTDNGNTNNTGNTFAHGAGDLAVSNNSFFDLALTDLNANEAVLIQGFQFAVIPEPSSTALLGLGGLAMILRRRK